MRSTPGVQVKNCQQMAISATKLCKNMLFSVIALKTPYNYLIMPLKHAILNLKL